VTDIQRGWLRIILFVLIVGGTIAAVVLWIPKG